MCTIFFYRNIAYVVASCNTKNIFFRQKKKSAKIKCLLFRPKPQKFHIAEITGYTVISFGTIVNEKIN